MSNTNELEVVAAMIVRDGMLLLAQRGPQGDQSGLWEFPGGKVDAGESQPQALKRELMEELAIDAVIGDYIASESRVVGERKINLHAWLVTDFSGEPTALCHQALNWVKPAEAFSFALAPADVPLLQAFLDR
ncbi:pyrimidine (deoxy)nucleoside triphosphate diphosphatase [Pantoea coffeiphila]|uniref:pyrimidine (deoxy)nucleoside triphosphate diphosphatase n=1 Tax=Pantoea coffeiphila TaxID=1465635 RepID=UPI0019613144|nr:pyrimidine (deoxy)nucleoside triphosphate diphosphatase [Pantoea coffeiphila]MBM7341125.1 (d)CTP diphosphatase [Pantoea coffeiphila]